MKRTAVGTPPVSAPRGEWYGGSMALGDCDCSFETDRLVDDWSRLLTGDAAEALRDGFVVSLLTAAVTRDLPPGWQGPYDMDRAASWFAERLREGTVLVVGGRSDGRPSDPVRVREQRQSEGRASGGCVRRKRLGRGLATEVVAASADWCRANGSIRSVVGGVAGSNSASTRVLRKNGFVPHTNGVEHLADEVEYTLTFTA